MLSLCGKSPLGQCAMLYRLTGLTTNLVSIFLPVKGAFALGKKIVKVSFPGVAVCWSCDVRELRCGRVAM